jgi:ABC-type oligopeptide transport system substrate-binding subunit
MLPLLISHPALERKILPSIVSLVFNFQKRPFHNPLLRRSFQQAVHREELIKLTNWPHLPSYGLSSYTPQSPIPSWAIKFAPDQVTSSLAQLKFDATNFRFHEVGQFPSHFQRPYLSLRNIEGADEIGENLRAQWLKNTGLRIELLPPQRTSNGETLSVPSMHLVEANSNPIYPLELLEQVLRPTGITAGERPKGFEKILDRMASAPDLSALQETLHEAEELLVAKESIVIPLFMRASAVLKSPKLMGLIQTQNGGWNFRKATLD